MQFMLNHPRLLVLICVFVLWGTAWGGAWLRRRLRVKDAEVKDNVSLVLGATLTLLGLIIGFTFSMASGRYDLRRQYEEAEANAIGTEYLRADLLPAAEAALVKKLLTGYTVARIHFFTADYGNRVTLSDDRTAEFQLQLWRAVLPAAGAAPTPITALAVSGMNDVINSQGYTQYAWWNRIPVSAWWLLIVIALFANGLVGYAAQQTRHTALLLWILPVLVSISFFLVADIDSPRGGIIRIPPKDLIALQKTLPQP